MPNAPNIPVSLFGPKFIFYLDAECFKKKLLSLFEKIALKVFSKRIHQLFVFYQSKNKAKKKELVKL